jgi:hypothetical protein
MKKEGSTIVKLKITAKIGVYDVGNKEMCLF